MTQRELEKSIKAWHDGNCYFIIPPRSYLRLLLRRLQCALRGHVIRQRVFDSAGEPTFEIWCIRCLRTLERGAGGIK